MKLACTLQVTAGVTVSSAAIPPLRASAESLGVNGPRCRGVNPTTIIANTAFNACLRLLSCDSSVASVALQRDRAKQLAKLPSTVARCPIKWKVRGGFSSDPQIASSLFAGAV